MFRNSSNQFLVQCHQTAIKLYLSMPKEPVPEFFLYETMDKV
jgi:hypothetical protein